MQHKQGLTIIGAGGHAKVVISTVLASKKQINAILDDDPHLYGTQIFGYAVIGTTALLATEYFAAATIALGNNLQRKAIVEKYPDFNRWYASVHPNAYVHPSAKIGEGTVIFAGAVIQPDVVIGKHCIINTGTTVDHDCVLGDYVHLAPGVHLAGNVEIGEGCFIGIGSAIIPQINIGPWVTVAAGGVVINDILANRTVMGVPAKERI